MACITLLSDFGLHDPSVAIVKGVFMQYTALPVIDITHEIKPFDIRQAAYLFSIAYKNFPEGSCHVLLFDLFSEPDPKLVLSELNGQYFLSPDNGLLPLALGIVPERSWLCYEINSGNNFIDWLHATGNIIGQPDMQKAAESLPAYQLKTTIKNTPAIKSNEIPGEAIHIDHYENVVVDITRQQFESQVQGRPFTIQFVRVEEISEISDSYNAVKEGYKLCRFNSNGYLEICINRGNAASLFGISIGSRYNDIKIIFE